MNAALSLLSQLWRTPGRTPARELAATYLRQRNALGEEVTALRRRLATPPQPWTAEREADLWHAVREGEVE